MNDLLGATVRASLMDELAIEGINTALPVAACGIDMLGLIESNSYPYLLSIIPINVRVLSREWCLPGDPRPLHLSGLLVMLRWDVYTSRIIRRYAFTCSELSQAPQMTEAAMGSFVIREGKWRRKFLSVAPHSEPKAVVRQPARCFETE
jgi:hypothetical protein